MTDLKLFRNKNGDLIKFIVDGHTDYAEEGKDIACAAVSALTENTLNGLTEILKIHIGYEIKDGYVECILPDKMTENERFGSMVLMESMIISFKNLKQQFKKHITITELEV